MAPLAAVIAKLMNAKLWVQAHGVDAWQELPKLYRAAIERADLITSVSRFTRRRLLRWCRIDTTRVKVLPDTVQPRFVPGPKPEYLLDRYGLRGKKILITVARLASSERYKGHDRVMNVLPCVLARHPDAVYVIVGEGDDRPRTEALATELGIRDHVHFVGFVAGNELPDHYRMADLMVMPSTGEGFGIAFLEALASGIPVIGGNRDGSLDPLAEGVLGTAVDPDNEGELAEAICAALANPRVDIEAAGRFKLAAFSEHVNRLVQFR
jgi:phosphatidylinositol alpha-1,6-mannosyltransferase